MGSNKYTNKKNINLDLITHVKITNYRQIVGLIVNDKTIKHLKANKVKYRYDHGVQKKKILVLTIKDHSSIKAATLSKLLVRN
jgi:hypothetical protein